MGEAVGEAGGDELEAGLAPTTRSSKKNPDDAAKGRWARLTDRTLAHPKRYLTVGVVLLLALAAPATGMRLGMPGARVVNDGRSSRDGYDRLVEAFGPVDWGTTLLFTAAATAGVGVGKRVADRIEPAMMQRAFAALLVAVALYTGTKAGV